MSTPKSQSKRTRTSVLWNYFTIIDKNYASCNMCGNRMSHCSSSSNLRKHLKRKHAGCSLEPLEITEQNLEFVNLDFEGEEENIVEEEVVTEPVSPPTINIPNNIASCKKIPKYPNVNNIIKPSLPLTKKVKSKNNNNSEMIQEAITILSNVAQTTNNTPDNDDDEFGQFGKYVAAQLRQLPILNALEIQEKFYSLLTRERISVMKNATELHSYGIKSYIQQCPEHCTQQQQNKHHQQLDQHQYARQKKPIVLQIESSCSLNDNDQTETETYNENHQTETYSNSTTLGFDNQNLSKQYKPI